MSDLYLIYFMIAAVSVFFESLLPSARQKTVNLT